VRHFFGHRRTSHSIPISSAFLNLILPIRVRVRVRVSVRTSVRVRFRVRVSVRVRVRVRVKIDPPFSPKNHGLPMRSFLVSLEAEAPKVGVWVRVKCFLERE